MSKIMNRFLEAMKLPEDDNEYSVRQQLYWNSVEQRWDKRIVAELTQPVSDPSQTLQNGRIGAVSMESQERDSDVANGHHKLSQSKEWRRKSARNGHDINATTLFTVALNVGAVAVCLAMTYGKVRLDLTLGAFFITAALFILTDPFEFVCRRLALQTRILISVAIVVNLIAYGCQDRQFRLVVGIADAVVVLVVKMANTEWLYTENYRMSRAVERVVNEEWHSKAHEIWKRSGEPDTVTLCHELGYEMYDNKRLFEAVWKLGFNRGYRKSLKLKQRERAADEKVEEAARIVEELEIEIRRMKEKYERAKAGEEEFREMYNDANEKRAAEAERAHELEIARIFNEQAIGKLKAQLDSMRTMPEQEDEEVEITDELIIETYEKLNSYRKAGEALGISKDRVKRCVDKHRKERGVIVKGVGEA